MEDNRRISLIVGAFFITALASLAFAVLTLSSESGLFTSYYKIYANFNNVQGLLPGAPVWMAGKEVGEALADICIRNLSHRIVSVKLDVFREEIQPA